MLVITPPNLFNLAFEHWCLTSPGRTVPWYIFLTKGAKGTGCLFAHATVVSEAQEVHGDLANHQIDEMSLKCTGYPRDPSLNSGLRRAK
eukprot:1155721-Pelagomonas_calceolata.AAC.1